MPARLDRTQLRQDLLRFLRRGPASGPELARALGISQPSLSRLVGGLRDEVIAFGRARRTRYAARRAVTDLGSGAFPVYEVAGPERPTTHLLDLVPVHPDGFVVKGWSQGIGDAHFPDLPWYLFDLRPAGFLGRLLPRRHPELGLPGDIRLWSSDHVLRYLVRLGWDGPGALVVGQPAMTELLSRVGRPADTAPPQARGPHYLRLASDVLLHGAAGSSAAGEQPKFLAVREDGVHVLVKFSPPMDSPVARRTGDVLIAEQIAGAVLRDHGHDAAHSEVFVHEDRVFLEVERFDRVGPRHRRGVVSLFALDAEHVGGLVSWADSARQLHERGLVTARDLGEIRWLQAFGVLAGNTDMHHGNISFFMDGVRPRALAPVYDMAPMRFAPRSGSLLDLHLEPRIDPGLAAEWPSAREVALDFWQRVAEDQRVSEDFRHIADESRCIVEALQASLALLPG